MQDFLLRCHTIDVSWEHRAFFDVGDAEEACSYSFQTDSEAAVRRHAVAEGVLSKPESIRIHASTEHLLAVVGCSVRPSASALSLPRASGAHISRPAWHIRAR